MFNKKNVISSNFWNYLRKMFIELLTSRVNASIDTKFVLLTNQKYMIQTTFINLHPNEYS